MENETIQEPIDAGNVDVVLSPKTKAVLHELNGLEMRLSNRLTGANVGNIMDNQALMSLVSVNGEVLTPVRNEQHLDARAQLLKGSEYMELIQAYAKAYFKDFGDPKA